MAVLFDQFSTLTFASNRTYKELKYINAVRFSVIVNTFQSYLQGIEIDFRNLMNSGNSSSNRTYKELKSIFGISVQNV